MATIYSEVGADRDVAAFIAAHADAVNLYALPVKTWVARDAAGIVAVLMLKTYPYASLDLIVAHPETRPFMRIFKLLRIAEAWLRDHGVPMIALSVLNTRVHFQALIRRLGYEKIGETCNADGAPIETIFGRRLLSHDSLDEARG